MNDPKDHPQASEPAGEQPSDATRPIESPAVPPADVPPADVPHVDVSPADQTAVQPQASPGGQAPPPYPYAPPPAPSGPGRFRKAAGNRVVQLVAVGVLGLVIGGGLVGGAAALSGWGEHGGRQDGRAGYSQDHHMRDHDLRGGYRDHGSRGQSRSGQGTGQGT